MIAAPIVSPLLIDRAEKAVLDCLEYSSKINCDKAEGALESVKISADQAYAARKVEANCAVNAATAKAQVVLFTLGESTEHAGLLKLLPELRSNCLKSK